jgi:DNA-binding NarL/FixJ family response regulator
VTPEGKPRRELLSFLKSIPDLELLNAPEGGLSSDALEADESRAVDLLIFDILSRDYDNWAALRDIRAQYPFTYCIMLIASPQQMAGAGAAGTDHTLLAGFSAAEFFEMLQGLG